MMHETRPLDYHTASRAARVQPVVWLSHMRTAALPCVTAILVDRALRYDALEARRVAQIEVALAVYGSSCAVVGLALGVLTPRDKFTVAGCAVVFVWTLYVGLLTGRVIHN